MSELYHHGIKNQKWGVRRYQNKDRTLTEAGRKRYARKNLEKATTRNLNKWGKDKNHNVLYVTGTSGSGKSTTAMGLANKKDNVIHIDTLLERRQHGNAVRNKAFEDFCKNKGINVSNARNEKLSGQQRWETLKSIANQIEPFGQYCYKNNSRVMVEGVQLADNTMFNDKSYYKDRPFVALRTGKAVSSIRAALRDNVKLKDIFKDSTDKERSEWNNYIEDNLSKLVF